MLDNLSHGDKIILNAIITAAIAALSDLITAGYPPTPQTLYAAILAFAMALMVQIKPLTADENGNIPPPPKFGMLI